VTGAVSIRLADEPNQKKKRRRTDLKDETLIGDVNGKRKEIDFLQGEVCFPLDLPFNGRPHFSPGPASTNRHPGIPKDFQFVGDEIYMLLSIVQCRDYEKICEGIYRLINGPTAI